MGPWVDHPLYDAVAVEPTVDITTTGRRSGTPRRIEIWVLAVEGRLFITGTPGRRDWLANVRADPRLTVHVTHGPSLDVAVTAIEVIDPETRRFVLEHAAARWYLSQTTLDDMLVHAPMVELAGSPQDRSSGPTSKTG